MEPDRDKDSDRLSRPGIPPPGKQPQQQQLPNAPPQPDLRQPVPRSQWIPPSTGNPDLDPPGTQNQRIDLRERNPLVPQGMLYDPRQLLDYRTQPDAGLPPGARFDPYGPPDPSQVGPGRGPLPSHQFGVPDPDHFAPPGVPDPPRNLGGKSLKWPPSGSGSQFPPPGGAGGTPFL